MILNEFAILGHQNRAVKYLKKRPKTASNVIKMFQIQSTYTENAYGPVTNFARTGTGPQPGGCRPLIYDNAVSRYFSKLFFAENHGKFSVLALFKFIQKSYRNIE